MIFPFYKFRIGNELILALFEEEGDVPFGNIPSCFVRQPDH